MNDLQAFAVPTLVIFAVVLLVMWRRHRSRAWDWDIDPSQNVGA